MLALEVAELGDFGIDAESLGFDDDELKELEAMLEPEPEEILEDEVPEVQENPYSKMGDLWLLGRHRCLCGDSTDEATVKRLMDGKKADLYLTDPPYNVDYKGSNGLKIKNDKMNNGEFRVFLADAFKCADIFLKEGGVFYIWHADLE